ncbi:MAG: HD domain-containing protein [Fibrobacter sp.]|nr:HD domain-containing protein [Fibrobacter sp.]
MAETLLSAIKALFCLNRWNVEPRIETWTEAENIAMGSHVLYAFGKHIALNDELLHHALKRMLFKSLNKYRLSDISAPVREIIQKNSPLAWQNIIDDAAKETIKLFPSSTANTFYGYMTLEGNYALKKEDKDLIEDLVKFVQYRVSYSECEPNKRAFPEDYLDKEEELETKMIKVLENEKLKKLRSSTHTDPSDLKGYLFLVRKLKHVRRWNRMNRFIESTVLAHTFIVTILATIFAELGKGEFRPEEGEDVQYKTLLLALFHDVPEMLTGDIISPVKKILGQYDPLLLPEIEKELLNELLLGLPIIIREDIRQKNLFCEPCKDIPFSAASLVKDCDILAALMECAFEMAVGNENPEIRQAFTNYYSLVQNSEWSMVREFSNRVRYEQEAKLF